MNMQDNFRWMALHHACHANQPDIAQLLVDNGAEVDAQALNGGNFTTTMSWFLCRMLPC